MPRTADALEDHVANEDEGLDQFDNDEDAGDLTDDSDDESDAEELETRLGKAFDEGQRVGDGEYQLIDLARLVESPKNNRKHFDPAKLEQLADNIRKLGVLTPLLARPLPRTADAQYSGRLLVPHYELAAGHRRFRASQMAGIEKVPVLVRDMDDVTFLEVLNIENLQRDDLHELEEAQGYRDLMNDAGYTAKRIADRVGRSEKYVYDRIKLLGLIPELQTLFLEKKIEAGHAIILARLSAEDQKRAADYPHGGLWDREESDTQVDLDLPDPVPTPKKAGGYGSIKLRSVRELQGWVNKHVRFDAKAVDPVLFPDTAATMASVEPADKVVSITHSSFVQPGAKTDERTFGPQSWKRADGRMKSKECDHSVIGVIVVGDGRGESFRVCVDKQKCTTHWGSEIRARQSRAKASPATSTRKADGPPQKQSWEIEQEQRDAKRAAWKKTQPAVVKALVDRVKQLPTSTLVSIIEDDVRHVEKSSEKLIGRGKGAEGFVRLLAFAILHRAAEGHSAYEYFPKYAKEIGLDLKKILEANAPAPAKPAAVTSTKPVFEKGTAKAKKPAKTKGKRTPNAAFMKPMTPSVQLQVIVGKGPMVRTEVTKKIWGYIKRNSLQDQKERRMINTDVALAPIMAGKKRVSMFEMTRHINKHLR